MTLAVLSDIHGNVEALKSVLETLKNETIDGFIFLGDYCCDFLEGEECIDIIRNLRYSKYIISGNREYDFIHEYLENSGANWSYDTTMGPPLLTCKNMKKETLEYLNNLEKDMIINIENTEPIYIIHKMPVDVEYLKQKNIKYILGGHTHEQHEGIYDGFIFYNPGSVGLADANKKGAEYGLLKWINNKWIMEFKHIDYNYKKEIGNIKSSNILMNRCKHWGEVLIKSVETGINLNSLYCFIKDDIELQYNHLESYDNIKIDANYIKRKIKAISPINTYIDRIKFNISDDENKKIASKVISELKNKKFDKEIDRMYEISYNYLLETFKN